MLRNALRATPHPVAAPPPSPRGEGLLSDFAFQTENFQLRRSLPVFLSRRKKNSEKERPLRGLRREVSPDLLRRTEMKRKTGAQCGSAPRDPPGNGQAGSDTRQRQRTQRRKFPYSGKSRLFVEPRGTTPTLASPRGEAVSVS